MYPLFYQLRFVFLVAVTVFFTGQLVVQVLIVTLSTIVIMILLGNVHPFSVVSRNYSSLIGEFVILIIMDLLLFSSDPSLDLDQRIFIGYGIMGILGISIVMSQGSLMYSVCRGMCHTYKLNQLRKKNMKLVKERQVVSIDKPAKKEVRLSRL